MLDLTAGALREAVDVHHDQLAVLHPVSSQPRLGFAAILREAAGHQPAYFSTRKVTRLRVAQKLPVAWAVIVLFWRSVATEHAIDIQAHQRQVRMVKPVPLEDLWRLKLLETQVH